MDALPPRQRMIIKLRFFNSLTLEEVGQRLDMKLEHVRQLEAKAMRSLRDMDCETGALQSFIPQLAVRRKEF